MSTLQSNGFCRIKAAGTKMKPDFLLNVATTRERREANSLAMLLITMKAARWMRLPCGRIRMVGSG